MPLIPSQRFHPAKAPVAIVDMTPSRYETSLTRMLPCQQFISHDSGPREAIGGMGLRRVGQAA
jgi:hypothetical protein